MDKLPLNDAIAVALSKLVDDSQVETREPSHYDIECEFRRSGLLEADPKQKGQTVGKSKRVRAVLYWSIENNLKAGERLVYLLLSLVKSVGGFRKESSNYVGNMSINNLSLLLKKEGFILSEDGSISSIILEDLDGIEKIEVLSSYAQRAIRGVEDAALLTGMSKDLMEAVSAFIVKEKWGNYPHQANFPTLLGQAFTALELATIDTPQPNEPAQKKVERAIYQFACSINKLRNKDGTGHGRPYMSTVTEDEAKLAIEGIGVISKFLLSKLHTNN
jgi:hypothetical protein